MTREHFPIIQDRLFVHELIDILAKQVLLAPLRQHTELSSHEGYLTRAAPHDGWRGCVRQQHANTSLYVIALTCG